MIKRIAGYLGKYKKYAIIGPIFVLIDVILESMLPLIMAKIIDNGIMQRDKDYIIKWGIVMIIVAAVAMITGALNSYFSSKSSQGLGSNLRKTLFSKVQGLSYQDIDDFSTSSLVTRTTSDVNNIASTTMMSLRLFVRAPLMFIVALVMTIRISTKLSSMLFIAIAAICILSLVIFRYVRPQFSKIQKRLDKLNSVVQENLIGQRIVKAFVQRKQEKEKFKDANSKLRDLSIDVMSKMVIMMPVIFLVMNFATVAALWLGGQEVASGTLLTGDLNSFIDYSMQLLISFIMIASMYMMVARTRASVDRVFEVLDKKPSISDHTSQTTRTKDGSIEFDHVTFSYEQDATGATIDDINFKIDSGSFTAFIGSTGAGKSTIVNLIPRLYDIKAGTIKLGGSDIKEYSLEALRDQIGVVPQKNVLFSGTVKDNIKWGNPNATDEEIISACKNASAHDFIMALPDGYDSWIERGGTNVSGGQRQRLCIARALVKQPKVLILDDSTSAVDTATEAKIKESLRNELKDTTLIMIAQRISSLRDADQIVVVDNGSISGIGTHDELIKTNAIYREIYETQEKEVA